tara:strand:+ start:4474 stop:5289 length:816 start_codon:yes stop_codon:yes gene_type:complete
MYAPKNRIKENLYTPGNEYVIKSTKANYSGFYHSLWNGKIFTGKTSNDSNVRELVSEVPSGIISIPPELTTANRIALFLNDPDPIVNKNQWNQRDVQRFLSLNGEDTQDDDPKRMPQTFYPKPTEDDYKLGVFTRYFVVKINELQYTEISEKQYKEITSKSNKIVWELFIPFKFQWTIDGVESNVFDINRDQVLIAGKNIQRQGLPEFLRNNYIQFYQSENINNQYTNGDDYTLPNGLSYQGLYHIMPNGIAMTGRFHGEADDILLTPFSS